MSQATIYQYVKLGMHLEYLRGLASVSIIPGTSLVEWPSLMNNQPGTRFSVMKVVEAIKAIKIQLSALGLVDTLEHVTTRLDPMLAQMEAALDGSPQPADVILRDEFANVLIDQANVVVQALKEESAQRQSAS